MRKSVCLSFAALLGMAFFATALTAQSKPADQAAPNGRTSNQGIGSIMGATVPPPSFAPGSLPADAPSRDQVLTLLDLMQIRKNMAAAMESMKQIMKQGAEQSFRERVPNPTPQQLAALRGMMDDLVDGISMDEMVNAVITIYQRHLNKTDIEEMIRFYSSPVGQKLLRETPQIMQESMQAGAAIQEKRMDEIKAKLMQREQELIEANEKKAAPRK